MELAYSLAIVMQAGLPPLLWGRPGIGKTSLMRQLGKGLDAPVKTLIAAIHEPADFLGLPYRENGATAYAPPQWAHKLKEQKRGLLFLDEISAAPPSVQNALFRVVLERVVGDDLELPPEVMICSAANPADQILSGWNLSAPLANRFVHFDWAIDAEKWTNGMLSGWPTPKIPRLPEGWREKHYPLSRALVAGYIKVNPTQLEVLPKDETQAGRAWPSGRSWDMAAQCLAAADSVGANFEAKVSLVKGCVGDGAALGFSEWFEKTNLPDPEDLLRDPAAAKLPQDIGVLLITLSNVVSCILNRNTLERWKAGWTLIGKALAQCQAPDVPAVFAIQLAQKSNYPPGFVLTRDMPAEKRPLRKILEAAGLFGDQAKGS